MNARAKLLNSLQVPDLEKYPVWDVIFDDDTGEVYVAAVTNLPVSSMFRRIVGTVATLANGRRVWTIINYLEPHDAIRNEQAVALRIERDGQWFDLARYWDVDYPRNGPDALAKFLGEASADVIFPISYDVSSSIDGSRAAVVAKIPKEPFVRLSMDEIIHLLAI